MSHHAAALRGTSHLASSLCVERTEDNETMPVTVDLLCGLGDGVFQAGERGGADIAFHLADWNSDVAFLTALHLFPERFTKEEIESGIRLLIIHAPNHLAEAAKLFGCPVENIFEREADTGD